MAVGVRLHDVVELLLGSLAIRRVLARGGNPCTKIGEMRLGRELLARGRVDDLLTPRACPCPIPLKVPSIWEAMRCGLQRRKLHDRGAVPALLSRDRTRGVEVGNGVALGQVRDAVVAGVRLQRREPLADAECGALATLLRDAPEVGERGASWQTRPPRATPSRSPSCMAGQAAE